MKQALLMTCLMTIMFQALSQNCRPRNNQSQGFYTPLRANCSVNYGYDWNDWDYYSWRGRGGYAFAPRALIARDIIATIATITNFAVNAKRISRQDSYEDSDEDLINHGDGWYSIRLTDAKGNTKWKSFRWVPGQEDISFE